MNREELVNKYPWLKEQSLVHSWADQIPEGWNIAFGELFFEDLDKAIKESYPDGIPDTFHIQDIKEKWGKLRVYLTQETDKIRDVLYIYEYLSSFVCIVCGAPYPFAQMTYDGWVMPLCERCYLGQNITNLDKYHTSYLQTVMKDCITVFKGPEDFITVESYDGENFIERKIETKNTWGRIFQRFIDRTVV